MKSFFLLIEIALFTIPLSAQTIINPCAQSTDIHVVVLGSSTAAGSGPSVPDSTWVNRYRKYLQDINPQNQVTNLAIGGTRTYNIMPDWFVPPPGRPAPNPNSNVSQAISLGADAIVVNMPSNDAASGYSVNEQMFNFITISNVADSVGIPVWVCTTQPRNGFSSTQKAIQTSVRDSVLNYFGPFAIDFWDGFADSTNNLLGVFDSGDGVHMNDTAHGILNHLVINEEIPNWVSDTLSITDHIITQFPLESISICGDSNALLTLKVVNLGVQSSNSINLEVAIWDKVNATTAYYPIPMMGPLDACTADTLTLSLNTYQGVDWGIQSYLISNDTDKSNDTSEIMNLLTQGFPTIEGMNDTLCRDDSTMLMAFADDAENTVFWYDSAVGGNRILEGNVFSISTVLNSQTYYAEAVSGNLYYDESLFTTATTTTNWNGIMFDIVATDSLTIDSLKLKINTLGNHGVMAYFRNGSYLGYEMDTAAWAFWGKDSVQVNAEGEFKIVDYSDLELLPQDTLGVYLHIEDELARLSYQNVSNITTKANSEIEIVSGAGVSHTFGTTYSPRYWSGEVFYHHGFNPQGDCVSPRIPVSAIVSKPEINLGNDTTLDITASFLLNPDADFASYLWSTGDTSPQLWVDSSLFSVGSHLIFLEAIDKHGCSTSDTIMIDFVNITTSVDFSENESIKFSPNPTLSEMKVEGLTTEVKWMHLLDVHGKVLAKLPLINQKIDLKGFSSGIYFLSFVCQDQKNYHKIILL